MIFLILVGIAGFMLAGFWGAVLAVLLVLAIVGS